ncbi:MAG: hypothetical protein PVSMB7_22480 [Chloroflexota bacterium]
MTEHIDPRVPRKIEELVICVEMDRVDPSICLLPGKLRVATLFANRFNTPQRRVAPQE